MVDILKRTAQEYGSDNVPLLAAALAYFSVFSLAPLLVIVIAVLVFFGAGGAQDTVMNVVEQAVGQQGATMVETMIESQEESGGGIVATVVGVVVLVFAATTLFAQLEKALGIIWKFEPETTSRLGTVRNIAMTRLRSLGLILAIGVLLLIAFVLSTFVSAALEAAGDALPGGVAMWSWLNRIVAFAALVTVFALVYKLLPRPEVPWKAVWIGASVTAAIFVGGTWLFGVYISNFAIASAYGAAGSLVVLLLWVYVSAQITLLGGELTYVLSRRLQGLDGIERSEA